MLHKTHPNKSDLLQLLDCWLSSVDDSLAIHLLRSRPLTKHQTVTSPGTSKGGVG